MFLTAKLNLISGIVIGAFAMIAIKGMCKPGKKHQESNPHTNESPSPAAPPDYPPTA